MKTNNNRCVKVNVMENDEKIKELLTRGVEDVFVRQSLSDKLQSGKKLRVKLGFDPTGSKIHIGRAIILRKLKAFQDLGHNIIFIVGDFTAIVGDPSDKLEKRPMLTTEAIKENLKTYKKQVGRIIDIDKAEFLFNGKWLSKLGFGEIARLAESFSVSQMANRRNFKDRLDKGEEVSLREFMYPLMQGYDSVMVKADVEIGGFDQLFNLKAGRIIQKHFGQPEQDILTTQMLEGMDGRKMSTSWGNVINITDEPNDMFGKVMSVKDELIPKYFLLCTDMNTSEIERMKAEMASARLNPRDAKLLLGEEIVKIYHGAKKAREAKRVFLDTFSHGKIPEDVQEFKATKGVSLSQCLLSAGLVSSKSEWRRLVGDTAVSIIASDGTLTKISDCNFKVEAPTVFKIGKHRFLKVVV